MEKIKSIKKAFISVPMKGRKKEDIEYSIAKMQEVTRAYLGDGVVFVNTIVQDRPPYEMDPVHNAIWYLGRSISLMAECDVLVTTAIFYQYKGCFIEKRTAEEYYMPIIMLDSDLICPDLFEDNTDVEEKTCCEGCVRDSL